jgi:hypothetical protein
VNGGRWTEQPNELIDADRLAGAYIVDFPWTAAIGCRKQRIDRIADKSEVARLSAVADNGQRLSGAELREKDSEDGSVGAAGPDARPINVEEPQRHRRQSIYPRPMKHELFAEIFGQRIWIAGVGGRRLRSGIHVRDPVARRRGGIHKPPRPMPTRRLEGREGAVDVGAKISIRQFDRRHDIGAPGQVKNPISTLARGLDRCGIGNIGNYDLKPVPAEVLLQIGSASDGKVVDDPHPPPGLDQSVDEVAADKTRSACDNI